MSVAIFTGSRRLSPDTHIDRSLLKHEGASFVGCCPTGLDAIIRQKMDSVSGYGDLHVIKARWDAEGRSAGPKRNSRMVKAAAALAEALGVELVCHAWPVGESRGTRDCMRKAEAAGARVVVHTEDSP